MHISFPISDAETGALGFLILGASFIEAPQTAHLRGVGASY